jgi:hypothetical protein
VSGEQESRISLSYVCEKNHLPCEHGRLEYVVPGDQWVMPHGDPRIQRLAQCFLASWLEKKRSQPDPQSENIHERN